MAGWWAEQEDSEDVWEARTDQVGQHIGLLGVGCRAPSNISINRLYNGIADVTEHVKNMCIILNSR